MSVTAEVLIKSKDQYSQLTDKAKRDMVELGRVSKQSMAQAKDSADILKDTFGIQIPRELTKLISQSKLIGPALSASFNVIALIGFIGVLRQVPEMLTTITESITGWDEASRKAYANFLEDNKKAIERVTEFHAKLAQVQSLTTEGGQKASLNVRLAAAESQLEAANKNRTLAQEQINALRSNSFRAAGPGEGTGPQRTIVELEADVKKFNDAALEAAAAVVKLKDELKLTAAADVTKGIKTAIADAKALSDALKEADSSFALWRKKNERGQTGFFDPQSDFLGFDTMQFIADQESKRAASSAAAGLNIRPALMSFFDPNVHDPAAVEAKQIARTTAALNEATEDFIRNFQQGAGFVWDTFTARGIGAMTKLSTLGSSLLSSLGRSLFQSFATGLFTGNRSSGGGIASSVGNFGASLGFGKLLGGAGLFGGGAAAAIPSVAPGVLSAGALAQIPGIGTGAFVGGGAAAGGGLAGMLGLGGGAGLLGLGALTIPVIGGAALGVGLILKKILGHKTIEAPFTKDPNEIERSRSILFFTGMDEMRRFFERLNTVPPGVLVKDGLPMALESSNQFRRNIAGTLGEDEL